MKFTYGLAKKKGVHTPTKATYDWKSVSSITMNVLFVLSSRQRTFRTVRRENLYTEAIKLVSEKTRRFLRRRFRRFPLGFQRRRLPQLAAVLTLVVSTPAVSRRLVRVP